MYTPILPEPMDSRHQRLQASLHRLERAEAAGLTNPRLRLVQPHHTRAENGGMTYPSTAHSRTTYSTRCEAVIVKVAQRKARREVWRARRDTALAFAAVWLGAGVVGAALFWVTGILVRALWTA